MDNIQDKYGVKALDECIVKFLVLSISLVVGLICSMTSEYLTFYVAAFVQSLSNLYDASSYLTGYNKGITISYVFICIISSLVFVWSLMFFVLPEANRGFLLTDGCEIFICILLSLPVIIPLVQIYLLIRSDLYQK